MTRWARFVTKGATNDYDKAQMLFANLMGRGSANAATSDHPPTAREVYYAWNKPTALFACQDLSFIYVALARECGLHAYHTFVEVDNRGVYVLHGCPAVFIGGRLVLADPAYSLFDIHHRKFTVLSDLETAGLYLAERGQLHESEIAQKLAPSLIVVQQSLFDSLANAGRWKEAEKLYARMKENQPASPVTHAVASKVAEMHGNLQEALRCLRDAAALAPDSFEFHFRLASLYMNLGNWQDAKRSFESAAKYAGYASSRDVAVAGATGAEALECLGKADWEGVVRFSDRSIALDPKQVLIYTARAAAKEKRGDFSDALSDYSQAVELRPDAADCYYNRARLEYLMENFSAATDDVKSAIKLDPKMGRPYVTLGYLQYDRHQFKEALGSFDEAIKAGAANDYVHFRVFLARSRMGEITAAKEELRHYIGVAANGSTNSWPMRIGKFLLGDISEDMLFAAAEADAAHKAPRRCEAWYFCGSLGLLAGDRVAARRCFESCLETNIPTFIERINAMAELKYLN